MTTSIVPRQSEKDGGLFVSQMGRSDCEVGKGSMGVVESALVSLSGDCHSGRPSADDSVAIEQ